MKSTTAAILVFSVSALSILAITAAAQSPDASNKVILVHGHRGARAWRPENTIPAFQFAIGHGVDVLELDLAVTKDNQLVVSHNPTLAPNSYPGERICKGPALAPKTPIRTMTLAEVREYDCGSVALAAFPKQVAVPGTKV